MKTLFSRNLKFGIPALCVLLLISIGVFCSFANRDEIISLDGFGIDFGTIPIEEVAKENENVKIIKIKNDSDKEINIERIEFSCSCLELSETPPSIIHRKKWKLNCD